MTTNKNQDWGGRRQGAGRPRGAWDPEVGKRLFEVSRLEEQRRTRAEAIRVVAGGSLHAQQALAVAMRRWTKREFELGRRVMTVEMGEAYMRELRQQLPEVAPCGCGVVDVSHVHCGTCNVPTAPFPGPVLLDGRALGPICNKIECYWAAYKCVAPVEYARLLSRMADRK